MSATIVWTMPFPSSWGVETRVIQEPRRSLRLEIRDQTGEQQDLKLMFSDVLSYKCMYLPALDAKTTAEFYDKLVALPAAHLGIVGARHYCYAICFDDGPFYEIVASNFAV